MSKADLENTFIRATRHGDTGNTKSPMNRSEFIDFIVRLGHKFVVAKYGVKEQIHERLDEFFQHWVLPISSLSTDVHIREEIRQSAKLNELLFDNHEGIRSVFESYNKLEGSSKGFTLNCARQFFSLFQGPTKMDVKDEDIERCFVHSIMTITHESTMMAKYTYLIFIEFQEMLCRLAYVGIRDVENIEFKVFVLLEYIWDHQINVSKSWQEGRFELKPVNQLVA